VAGFPDGTSVAGSAVADAGVVAGVSVGAGFAGSATGADASDSARSFTALAYSALRL
jgi:hypothetical protein